MEQGYGIYSAYRQREALEPSLVKKKSQPKQDSLESYAQAAAAIKQTKTKK